MDIQSTKSNGTTITIFFPATRELLTQKREVSIGEYKGQGQTILIVDDLEEQREVANLLLKELGYRVHTASSGEDAVEYLKTNSVDLVILDMIMDPGMDGLDTYREILQFKPRQKVIIASGFSETERVKEAKSLGAKYIKKPYTLSKIGKITKEQLEKNCWEVVDCLSFKECAVFPDHGKRCWETPNTIYLGDKPETFEEKMSRCKICQYFKYRNKASEDVE